VRGGVYRSVTNVGRRPTVSRDGPVVCETHIIGCSLELYGEYVTVELLEKLRGEQRFAGMDELKAAVLRDIERARMW
jgi:riboflavin kinase/FMN adenylyltransferase